MPLPQITLRSGNKDRANQWKIVPVDTPQVNDSDSEKGQNRGEVEGGWNKAART